MVHRQSRRPTERSTGAALFDLALVNLLAVLTAVLWLFPIELLSVLRLLVGIPFVLLLPGYALTAALFPGRTPSDEWSETSTAGRLGPLSVPGLERAVLSVGLSIFTVPLLGLFLNFSPWGITPGPYLVAILLLVVVGTLVAGTRRLRLPASQRFSLSVRPSLQAVSRVDTGTKRVNVAILSLLVLSVVVAGGAIAIPDGGERYTEFYLLTEDEASGDLVADGYPAQIGPDESETIHVGVGNYEDRPMEYTVVVQVQRVQVIDGERVIVSRTELDRYEAALEPGETSLVEQELTGGPELAGDRLRVTFLLYTSDVGEVPDIQNAYRTTHLWIDFTTEGGDQ